MSELDKELALQWMEKARHDLFTARRVLDAEDGPTDTPCFHAQQTVEKTLKAILTAAGVRYERVHDLMPLLEKSAFLVPELNQFREVCAQLSEYAVQIRYPSETADPDRTETDKAVQAAAEIFALGVRYFEKLEG